MKPPSVDKFSGRFASKTAKTDKKEAQWVKMRRAFRPTPPLGPPYAGVPLQNPRELRRRFLNSVFEAN
jgi:hypothetical protein